MATILVVDDEAHTTRLLELRLVAEGHSVDIATDGLEALERLETKRYDVVITDICMPRMGGRELCDEIRKLGVEHEPALIVCTSRPEPGYRGWIEALSDAILMEKPLSIQRLIQHLAKRFEAVGGEPGKPE